jgi:hypothetical protein
MASTIERLARAEGRVAEAERLLAHQRVIVAQLERDAHDADHALALLKTFEQTYASLVAERDRLRDQLGWRR